MMSLAIKEMHDAQENVRQQQLTGGDGAWEVPKKKKNKTRRKAYVSISIHKVIEAEVRQWHEDEQVEL